jgi:hypothetical protein
MGESSQTANTDHDLLCESDVLKRWPVLSKLKLLAARNGGRIAWVCGKRKSAWYRPSSIENYITMELEKPCHVRATQIALNSAASGSPVSQEGGFTDIGMTPAMEEHVALACAQTILKPLRAASRKSS